MPDDPQPAQPSGIGRRRAAARDEAGDTYRARRAGIRAAAAESIRAGAGTAPETLGLPIESLKTSSAKNYPFLYVFIQENLGHVGDRLSA